MDLAGWSFARANARHARRRCRARGGPEYLRQIERHDRPSVGCDFRPSLATMILDDVLDEGKTDTRSADAWLAPRAIETVKDAPQFVPGNALTVVAHANCHTCALRLDRNLYVSSLAVLYGVVEQVDEGEQNRLLIDPNVGNMAPTCQRDVLRSALHPVAKRFDRAPNEVREIAHLHLVTSLAAFERREIQHIVDERGEALGFRANDLEVLLPLRRIPDTIGQQELSKHAYSRQRRFQLMGDVCDEVALQGPKPLLFACGVQ